MNIPNDTNDDRTRALDEADLLEAIYACFRLSEALERLVQFGNIERPDLLDTIHAYNKQLRDLYHERYVQAPGFRMDEHWDSRELREWLRLRGRDV